MSPTVKKSELDRSPFHSPSPQDTSPRISGFTQHHRPVIAVHSGEWKKPPLYSLVSINTACEYTTHNMDRYFYNHLFMFLFVYLPWSFFSSLISFLHYLCTIQGLPAVHIPPQHCIFHHPPYFPKLLPLTFHTQLSATPLISTLRIPWKIWYPLPVIHLFSNQAR